MSENEYYKKGIIQMVRNMESGQIVKMIFGFVSRLYREENG